MKRSIVDGHIPYTVTIAEAVTVGHKDGFVFSCEDGRSLYGFIHVLCGRVKYAFLEPKETVMVEQGKVIYIPKGVRYVCTWMPGEAQVVIFQFDLHKGSPEQPCGKPVLMPSDTGRLFRGSTDQYALFDGLRCAARIYDLLGILRQEGTPMPKKYRRLLPALEEMERNPAAKRDVSYYAELCQMSIPGFRRSFKEYVGHSPVEYRNGLRLANARKLIMSGEYSVEEAAQISGFTNLSFFYRLFRRSFGVKPGSL